MRLASRAARPVLALWVAMPWLFLACFGVFLAAVVFSIGRLPSYSNPDPKRVAGLGPVHHLTSPLVVGVSALIGHVRGRAPASRADLLDHALGVLFVLL